MKKSTLLFVSLAAASVINVTAGNPFKDNHNVIKTDLTAEKYAPEKVTSVRTNFQVVTDKYSRDNNKSVYVAPKDAEQVVAGYKQPEGFFHRGLDPQRQGMIFDYVFGPAYVPFTLTNTSTGATSYEWTYLNPETFEDDLTSTDENLTVTYPWSSLPAPALTAINGNVTNTYDPYAIASESYEAYEASQGTTQLVTNNSVYQFCGTTDGKGITTTPMNKESSLGYSTFSVYAYDVSGKKGFTENGFEQSWLGFFEGYSDIQLTAFANLFPKPASTYCISKFWAWVSLTVTADTELTCKIWEVTDDGKITDHLIAFGTAIVTPTDTDLPTFELKSLDEFGFESTDPININSAIMVEISGFAGNPNIKSLKPIADCCDIYPDREDGYNPFRDANLAHAYNKFSLADEDGAFEAYIKCPWSYYTDETYSSLISVDDWMFMLDAEFWWLDADEYEYHFPNEGGSYDINMYGYHPHALPDAEGNEYYWSAEPVDPEADVDWLEISFESEDEYDPEANEDVYNGVTLATFTAEPLPEGVEGRSVDVKISYPGAELVISLSQGVLGVKDVTVKSAQYVNVVGNDFVVKATSDVTKAEVYTAAGVKVAEAAVNGTATINAAGLAHGVYFVKLNNGKTVKVVK